MISSIFVVFFFILIIYQWSKNKSFNYNPALFPPKNIFYCVEYSLKNGSNTYSTLIHLAGIFIVVFQIFFLAYSSKCTVAWDFMQNDIFNI